MADQHLEGAAVAHVRELALEHVEAQFAGLRRITGARHELEARAGIDEAADQPRRGDAINLDALARHPRAILERASRWRGGGLAVGHVILFLFQRGLET